MTTLPPASSMPANERTHILENTVPPSFNPQQQQQQQQQQFEVYQQSGKPELATPDTPPKLPPGLQSYNEEDPKREKSSIAYTAFNYINSIVGSGVIGMPYALHKAGLGVGMVLLLVVMVVTDHALCLMLQVARTVQVDTYQDLVKSALGKPGFILTSCLQCLYPVISLISYNIIVGDTLTKVILRIPAIQEGTVLAKREFIIAASTLLITLPLSLYRNITHLSKVSLTSVVMIVVIALAMIARAVTLGPEVPSTENPLEFWGSNASVAIGIMSFAFMCHHSSFLVFESLADNTQERWNKVTHISIGASGVLSAIFALAGYLTFAGFTQGDVFENYCWSDDLMNACRGIYCLTILLTYPIECFVARDVLETAFFRNYQPQPFFRHAVLSVVIACLCMLFSLTTDCLGIVLELNGIVCAIPLAYILPAFCYIRLQEGPVFARNKWSAWAVGCFGLVTFIFGIIYLFMDFTELAQCSHGVQMPYCYDDNLTLSSNEEL